MKQMWKLLIASALFAMTLAPLSAMTVDDHPHAVSVAQIHVQVLETVTAAPQDVVFVEPQVMVVENLFVASVVYKPPGISAGSLKTINLVGVTGIT